MDNSSPFAGLTWTSLVEASIQRSLVEGPDGPLLVPTKTLVLIG